MKVENVLTCALRSDSSVKFYFYYQTLPVILDLHKSNLLFLESHWNPDFPPDCQDLQYYINGRVLGTNGLHRVFVIPDNTFLNHILHWKVILLLAGSYFIIPNWTGIRPNEHQPFVKYWNEAKGLFIYQNTLWSSLDTFQNGITCICNSGWHLLLWIIQSVLYSCHYKVWVLILLS